MGLLFCYPLDVRRQTMCGQFGDPGCTARAAPDWSDPAGAEVQTVVLQGIVDYVRPDWIDRIRAATWKNRQIKMRPATAQRRVLPAQERSG